MKILIVDDDESGLRILQNLIMTAGSHEAYTAANGLFGYSAFLLSRPQLVLTDIEMPLQNGFEMMRRIRSMDRGVRTIYMTAEVERYGAELLAERQKHGAAVLEKPFSCRELLALISSDYEPQVHLASMSSMRRLKGRKPSGGLL